MKLNFVLTNIKQAIIPHCKKAATLFTLLLLLGTAGCQETPPLSGDSSAEASKADASGAKESDSGSSADASARIVPSSAKAAGGEPAAGAGELSVHYMDVGQGDATLVVCGEDAMLIDAGDNDKGTAVQAYLFSQNITELDYLVGTHPDADHIGGMDVVVAKFDCGTVFLTEEEKDTKTYEDVISAMEYKGYEKTLPAPGETYPLGDASFTILAPLQANSDSNDNSIALLLTYGDTRFYFEGDAGEEEEEQILASGARVDADVYKIGHHGSKTSTTDEMLSAVNPDYAVISAGEDNRYGHPHAEVLNKLRSGGIKTFRTDEQGTVVAKSDGKTIRFNMSPSDTWQAGEPGSDPDREPAANGKSAPARKDSAKENAAPKNADSAKENAVPESANSANENTSPESANSVNDNTSPESANSVNDNTSPESTEIIVHITDTGKKYHAKGCRFLKDSDMEISLEDAKAAGYEPCKTCRPPT